MTGGHRSLKELLFRLVKTSKNLFVEHNFKCARLDPAPTTEGRLVSIPLFARKIMFNTLGEIGRTFLLNVGLNIVASVNLSLPQLA